MRGGHPPADRHLAAALALMIAALSAGVAHAACAAREETYYARLPLDVLTMVSGGGGVSDFPAGAGRLSEPGVKGAGALVVKLNDSGGEAVGVGSQLTQSVAGADGAPARQRVAWTLVIPNRGALFLQQVEDVAPAVRLATRMRADPGLTGGEFQNTVGPRADGRGVIVGGSGVFEGCAGSFVEIDRVERVDPANPVILGIVGVVELRLRFGS